MPTITTAYTSPINPPSQHPLTLPQIWAGLVRKVHHASEFVPVIQSCTVASETKSPDGQVVVTRYVNFGSAAPIPGSGEVKEVCTLFPPYRVDFVQEDGTKVWNYVSQGPGTEGEDLYLTYVFEARVEAGATAEEVEGRFKATAKRAVESSIETIRRLVAEGKL